MKFYGEKDLALCGLACVLCSEEACTGCKQRGCFQGCDCSVYQCAMSKGLDGCYQCDEFPCGEGMLQGIRNRAFNQYARQFGKPALLQRLKENFENGIVYHNPDGLKGDYDDLGTEEEIMRLIQFGRQDPYRECPTLETEHFTLRLIREEDAEDLHACYGDPQARRLLNDDNCPPFEFSAERLPELVRGWLVRDYALGNYIRFSIVDTQTKKAVGTMEVYDRKVQQTQRTTGILRVDIASAYERAELLEEIIAASCRIFFDNFHSEVVLTKAIPEAEERIAALRAQGFLPFEDGERQHYHILRRQT